MLLLLRSSWHSGELLLPLVVQRSASADDIKKAYQKLAFKLCPEESPENREVAEKKFREVTIAHKILPGANKPNRMTMTKLRKRFKWKAKKKWKR